MVALPDPVAALPEQIIILLAILIHFTSIVIAGGVATAFTSIKAVEWGREWLWNWSWLASLLAAAGTGIIGDMTLVANGVYTESTAIGFWLVTGILIGAIFWDFFAISEPSYDRQRELYNEFGKADWIDHLDEWERLHRPPRPGEPGWPPTSGVSG